MTLNKKSIGISFVILIVGFIAIQFVDRVVPALGRDNPPVIYQMVWDSPQTEDLMRAACYDCHSNETTWPWYSRIAPVSWLVAHDVNEGRDHLNFSTGGGELQGYKLIESIREGEMPPLQYTAVHGNARLSDAEKTLLIDGIAMSMGGFSVSERDIDDD